MTVVQISRIQVRRGPEADLPGAPTDFEVPRFSPGLAIGELALTTDTGRLFIGHQPGLGQPGHNRITFPYQNTEILTENSHGILRRINDAGHRQSGRGSFFEAILERTTQMKTLYYVPAPGAEEADLIFTGPYLSATMEYFLFEEETSKPVGMGRLSMIHDGGAAGNAMVWDDQRMLGPGPSPITWNIPRMGYGFAASYPVEYRNTGQSDLVVRFRVVDPTAGP